MKRVDDVKVEHARAMMVKYREHLNDLDCLYEVDYNDLAYLQEYAVADSKHFMAIPGMTDSMRNGSYVATIAVLVKPRYAISTYTHKLNPKRVTEVGETELSLEKWEFMLVLAETYGREGWVIDGGGNSTCALCAIHENDSCATCPISKFTGFAFCIGSPYPAVSEANPGEDKIEAIRDQIEFLRMVLNVTRCQRCEDVAEAERSILKAKAYNPYVMLMATGIAEESKKNSLSKPCTCKDVQ